jgi:hypothetical protein
MFWTLEIPFKTGFTVISLYGAKGQALCLKVVSDVCVILPGCVSKMQYGTFRKANPSRSKVQGLDWKCNIACLEKCLASSKTKYIQNCC